jgi:DNA-binding MarR family transcriptional regulator
MPEAATDTVSARLAFAVGRLNRRLASATGGLSHSLLSALAVIAKQGPMRFAEVAQIEMVSAPSITRVIAELESRGLVDRAVDPEDGRAFLIEVTEAGMQAVLRARAARTEVVVGLLAALDKTEVDSIAAALPALERVIGEM